MFTKGLLIAVVCAVANAQMSGMMQSGNSGPNFNLSTPQGIQGFLAMENIVPSSIVTSNCIPNGNPCTPSGTVCCLSPVMICQPTSSGSNMCLVDPQHRVHIPMIQQILQTVGYSTQNPIQ